jgi:N-methylhydantoinase A
LLVGCDTGGTFTDFVMADPDRPGAGLTTWKVSSTPDDPSRAILLGLDTQQQPLTELCHATTVATNALLEGRLGSVAYVTTEGFGDALWLGRGERSQLYSLRPSRIAPPLERGSVHEVDERIDALGGVLRELRPEGLERLRQALQDARPRPEAIAVCLLHATLHPIHEQALDDALAPLGLPVFLSHRIAPSPGEYERGMTTLLAAALEPKIGAYLERLGQALGSASLWIVHSAGGLLRPREARQAPHRLALSGPAAGLRGALSVGRACGQENLLTLDMGGTSTDVALCHGGELPYLWETQVAGYPLRAPSLEIHTVGAGGGSIAYRDAGGFLRVGPRSAGAVPGPACYGRGGREPAVTDALCWAGYLPERLGYEGFPLDRQASESALTGLARELGLSVDESALGILEVAVGHLGLAVRKVSTGRGHDPAAFTLFPFGGAGPMLACQVAESLDMSRVLVPRAAGVLSAWGALTAPWEREWSAPLPAADRLNPSVAGAVLERLRSGLRPPGSPQEMSFERLLARRYKGQGDTLVSSPEVEFHDLHQARFGFQRRGTPVETVEVRWRCRGPERTFAPGQGAAEPWVHQEPREVLTEHGRRTTPVFRGTLPPGERQSGPFLHFASGSTLMVASGWLAEGLPGGHLLLLRQAG